MRVLVVAAHPDDEVLGCGGTIAKHVENGDEVRIALMSMGVTSRFHPGRDPTGMSFTMMQEVIDRAGDKLGTGGGAYQANLPDQRFDSKDRLEVVRRLESVTREVSPEIVYTHHMGDLNLDHRITCEAVLTACRPLPGSPVKAIYGFEVVSSTEWGVEPFVPNRFVDISKTLRKKFRALRAYRDEMRKFPHARSYANVGALARHRGASVGVKAAEAFTVLREIA